VASIPLSRQAFLKGVAGMAAVAATGPLWTKGSDQGASVTVNLSKLTGRALQQTLYGYATGALLNDSQPASYFNLAGTAAVQKSAEILAPPLIRFNTPASDIIQTVFADGVDQPRWASFENWFKNRADFLGRSGRLVFGIGPSSFDTKTTPAQWAQYARATALHFRAVGQETTYWEVGNECDQIMDALQYSKYFNAIADALHSVNSSYLVGGPVSSWYGGMNLAAFAQYCGSRIGFIDFHSYPIGNTEPAASAYAEAANFPDVAGAREALQRTAAADLPIALLEYNMDSRKQKNGNYGIPAQAKVEGAVYVALLLTQAFTSDPKFTMAGLWDLVGDSNYGAIGNVQNKNNYSVIDEQGWYLRQAALRLPGQQVQAATTAADLQVLATRTGDRFSIQLVNYALTTAQAVAVSVSGWVPGSKVTRWELSSAHRQGHSTTLTSLAQVKVPAQSIVILNGQRAGTLMTPDGRA
jgi:hypothetical protein